MTAVTSRGTVEIDTARCKGCTLCVPACPPRVLEMSPAGEVNATGFRYPVLHPGCTGCSACLLVCPDFCFSVHRFATPQVQEGAGPGRETA